MAWLNWKGPRAGKRAVLAFMGGGLAALAASVLLPALELGEEALKVCLQISVAVTAVTLFFSALFIRRIIDDSRQIAESEQRFRRAMEDSAIGVAIVGLDGRIVQANPAFADMLGYTRSEIEALTFFQITYPDDLQIGRETMMSLKEWGIALA